MIPLPENLLNLRSLKKGQVTTERRTRSLLFRLTIIRSFDIPNFRVHSQRINVCCCSSKFSLRTFNCVLRGAVEWTPWVSISGEIWCSSSKLIHLLLTSALDRAVFKWKFFFVRESHRFFSLKSTDSWSYNSFGQRHVLGTKSTWKGKSIAFCELWCTSFEFYYLFLLSGDSS